MNDLNIHNLFQIAATHVGIAVFPLPELSAYCRRVLAGDLICGTAEFLKLTGGFCEITEPALADLYNGNHPRKLWGQVYSILNSGRHVGTAPAEPSKEDCDHWCRHWGHHVADGAVTILVPLPYGDEFVDADKVEPALDQLLSFLRAMPLARLVCSPVSVGTAAERLGMNRTRHEIPRRIAETWNENDEA